MGFYETAPFEVIETHRNKIELRRYPTLYMASTKTKVDNKMSSGFSNVFRYISGFNQENKKISMTTPVVSRVEKDMLITQFLVPTEYGDSPPLPKGDDVTIEKIEEGLYMAIKFSGSWTKQHFKKIEEKLLATIKEFNYVIDSERMVLRYQPPFIPGFLRRNEIMYKVLFDNT